MYLFSKTVDPQHYESYIDIRDDLRDKNVAAADQKLIVRTTDLFRAGFSAFPQVSQNEYVNE